MKDPVTPVCPRCDSAENVKKDRLLTARWECDTPNCWTIFKGLQSEYDDPVWTEARKRWKEQQSAPDS